MKYTLGGFRVASALVAASWITASAATATAGHVSPSLTLGPAVVLAYATDADQTAGEPSDETGRSSEHGESHGGGAQAESMGPLAWDTDLAIWTAVVFLVLFAVLYRFAWGPIRDGLDKREQRIADNIAAAQQINEEAKQLLVQYEKKLDESQVEVRAILDEARRDAEHTQREILAKAASESDAVRERAKREIETATAQALKQLAETASQLAVDLAGKIIRAELDSRKHSGLIAEAMARFPKGVASEN